MVIPYTQQDYIAVLRRAEKAEAEKECDRRALAGCYEERRRAEIEREELRKARDALAAERDGLKKALHVLWNAGYLVQEHREIIDKYAPGWRSESVRKD